MSIDRATELSNSATLGHITTRKALRDTSTMARRGLLKFKHTPQQLLDVIVVPIVFTVMFANIFGGAIAGSVDAYLPILIPGVLVNIVITSTVVVGVQLRVDIDRGVFDRFVSLPISRIAPLSGSLVAAVVRYVIAIVITLLVGLCMGYQPASALGTLASIALVIYAAFSLSWIFAFIGVLMSKASSIQGISALTLTTLGFMSNAFVPTESMPDWMRTIADINPISHLVSAVRSLANEGQADMHIVWSLLGSTVIIAVFAPLTVKTYLRRL